MAEVIAVVRAAIDAFTRRHQDLLAAVDSTKQVLDRLNAITTGSSHAAPRAAHLALDQSRNELEESAANAGETVQLLTSYLAALEGSGTETSKIQTPHRTTATPTTSRSEVSELPQFDAQKYLDALPTMKPKKQRTNGQKHAGHG